MIATAHKNKKSHTYTRRTRIEFTATRVNHSNS